MRSQDGRTLGLYAKLALSLLVGLLATTAHATCSYAAGNAYGSGPADLVVPLNISALTVGRDMPNGTVLYNQVIRPMAGMGATCRNDGAIATITTNYWLTSTPLPLSTWTGTPYPSRVYQTGVPGIGVALRFASTAFPYSRSFSNGGSVGGSQTWTNNLGIFDITIIKIGPVSPGVIQAANLPRMQYDFVTDNTLPLMRTRFTGSIQIVAQTCTTPDVTVPLGAYKVNDFGGMGTGTPLKDFVLELQNCPAFYGASASLTNTDSATGWVESGRTISPNVLRFSLTPVNGTVSSQPGTLQLSPGTSGAPAATGIGVQLSRALDGYLQFDTLLASGITPTSTSGSTYRIPMQARYVQTGTATPTPGPANASVMFTINYQ